MEEFEFNVLEFIRRAEGGTRVPDIHAFVKARHVSLTKEQITYRVRKAIHYLDEEGHVEITGKLIRASDDWRAETPGPDMATVWTGDSEDSEWLGSPGPPSEASSVSTVPLDQGGGSPGPPSSVSSVSTVALGQSATTPPASQLNGFSFAWQGLAGQPLHAARELGSAPSGRTSPTASEAPSEASTTLGSVASSATSSLGLGESADSRPASRTASGGPVRVKPLPPVGRPQRGLPYLRVQLDDRVRKSHALLFVPAQQRLWFGGPEGVFTTGTDGKGLRMINQRICIELAFWEAGNVVLAFVGSSGARKGPQSKSSILVYSADEPRPPIRIIDAWKAEYGRPRHVAVSQRRGLLFMTTKHEDASLRPTPGSSILRFRVEALASGSVEGGEELLGRYKSNLLGIAVAEERPLLAVSERTDCDEDPLNSVHRVDLFDLEGNFLRTVADGGSKFGLSPGHVKFPKALAFTGSGNEILVVDEFLRVQSFPSDAKFSDPPERAQVILQNMQEAERKIKWPEQWRDLKRVCVVGETVYAVGHRTDMVERYKCHSDLYTLQLRPSPASTEDRLAETMAAMGIRQ